VASVKKKEPRQDGTPRDVQCLENKGTRASERAMRIEKRKPLNLYFEKRTG